MFWVLVEVLVWFGLAWLGLVLVWCVCFVLDWIGLVWFGLAWLGFGLVVYGYSYGFGFGLIWFGFNFSLVWF